MGKISDSVKKIGIVGCGYVAGFADDSGKRRHIYTHAKALSLMDEAKIVACCDTQIEQVKKFGDRWNIKNQYTDLKKMLEQEEIDILTIATPTACHYENILEALLYPLKAIFCEKPLCDTYIKAIEVAQEVNKKKVPLAVNFMRRWDPLYQECVDRIHSGELGRLESIVCYVDTALYMNAIHMFDLLIKIAGDIEMVIGMLDRYHEPRLVHNKPDRGAFVWIRHKNGILSYVKATGESRRNHYFELDLQCSRGRMRILDDDLKYEIYRFQQCPDKPWLSKLVLEESVMNNKKPERMLEAYHNIIRAIDFHEPLKCSGFDGAKSLQLIEIIYESDKLNQQPIYFHHEENKG